MEDTKNLLTIKQAGRIGKIGSNGDTLVAEQDLSEYYNFLPGVSMHYNFYKIDDALGNCGFMKGTKTYEYSSKDWYRVNQPVSKKYWNYLNLVDSFFIRFSYYQYLTNQFRYKWINKDIVKQLLKKKAVVL